LQNVWASSRAETLIDHDGNVVSVPTKADLACDSKWMLDQVKQIKMQNVFGLEVSIVAVKYFKGWTREEELEASIASLSQLPTSQSIKDATITNLKAMAKSGPVLRCYGTGYTSAGVQQIEWELRWLDDAETQAYITVETFEGIFDAH
jgi:hypothetical protein